MRACVWWWGGVNGGRLYGRKWELCGKTRTRVWTLYYVIKKRIQYINERGHL